MPVPKRKRSKSRRDKRFANKGLKVQSLNMCAQCNEPIMPHTACKQCGFYRGAKVLKTKDERGTQRKAEQQAKSPESSQEEK